MTRILITGANGQLGNALRLELAGDPNIDAVYTDVEDLDITNAEAVENFLRDNAIEMMVNCAAYTAVDRAESDELRAAAINTEAVGIIGQAAGRLGIRVIHISTDYVFSGESYRPYEEKDEPFPQSIYGRTKLEGEGLLTSFCKDAVIIRTAWLYSEFGNNFVKTMLRLAGEREELGVVSDQIGTPTYAGDLAAAIHAVIRSDEWKPGIYHFTNEGVASWYDFAKSIFEIAGKDIRVKPLLTSEYPTAARRPMYSVLSKNKIKRTYNIEIPYWRESLEKCIGRLGNTQNV